MLRALGAGEAAMTAMQNALDTVANNLANLDTNSYKAQTVAFADLVYQPGANSGYPRATAGQDVQLGTGSRVAAIGRDLTQGNFQQTNRPLDLAIDGPGYFAVSAPGGRTLYTRYGHLEVNGKGQLVTGDGYALGVTLPSGYRGVKVDGQGKVTVTGADGQTTTAGTLRVVTFANPQGLVPLGDGLYQAGTASGTASSNGAGRIVAGSLEQSNVSLIGQMADLMVVERSYQFDGKAVQTADSMWLMANGLYR